MDFIAIDFETANASRSSACSLGAVHYSNGRIVREKSWLIDPEEHFDGRNIAIHGITPSMVRGQPTFGQLWPELAPWLAGQIVVAHNASFDMSVLRYCLDKCGAEYPSFQYLCTYLLSKKLLGQLDSHRLDTVSRHFGIGLNHHDALDDARAAAKILGRLMEKHGHTDPLLLSQEAGYASGTLHAAGYTPFTALPKKSAKKTAAKKAANPAAAPTGGALTETSYTSAVAALWTAGAGQNYPALIQGQRIPVNPSGEAPRLLLEFGWEMKDGTARPEVDVSAFIADDSGRCRKEEDLIFYGNHANANASVVLFKPADRQSSFLVGTAGLPEEAERILFALTLYNREQQNENTGQLAHAGLRIVQADTGATVAVFPLDAAADATGIAAGELYKQQGEWWFHPIGRSFPGGLKALCERFGLEAAEEPAM